MKARQLLIATPLLKWYLDHGLEVTKIYQVVEFKPQRCFYQFVQDVSDARRQGDSDPSKAILADTRKLEGNASYGVTIICWLVGFGFNGPLRQYFSLYRAVSQREGERGKKG